MLKIHKLMLFIACVLATVQLLSRDTIGNSYKRKQFIGDLLTALEV